MVSTKTPVVLWETNRAAARNNCACPTLPTLPPPLAAAEAERWERPSDLYSQRLDGHHTVAMNPRGHAGPVVLNDTALAEVATFAEPQPVQTQAARQLAAAGLLQSTNTPVTLPDAQPEALTAWLHVTNDCNLRCTYCYVEKTDAAMDENTGKAAIDAIIRSAQEQGFATVNLKYAGGEATLNFRLVQTLHRYAQCATAEAGLLLQSGVLSNGVALTNGMLDFLRENEIQLMISLDGSATEHDRQRVFVNGRGSYRQVTSSIERALARGVQPHLSITVTGESVDGLADAVQFALDRELLFNLNFYREHAPHKSHAELRAEDERLIAALRRAFVVIEAQLPRQSIIGALIDRSSFVGPHQRSCGAGHSYMVIDHNGGVARCQMEIEQTVTDVFAANPLQEIQLYADGFQNLAVDEKEGCRECEWRYWCAGGCSLLTHRVTGRSDVKSPYCHVYKAIYPDVIRLEGLRLLKWRTN